FLAVDAEARDPAERAEHQVAGMAEARRRGRSRELERRTSAGKRGAVAHAAGDFAGRVMEQPAPAGALHPARRPSQRRQARPVLVAEPFESRVGGQKPRRNAQRENRQLGFEAARCKHYSETPCEGAILIRCTLQLLRGGRESFVVVTKSWTRREAQVE